MLCSELVLAVELILVYTLDFIFSTGNRYRQHS
jgi:hypothetical protein